MTDAPKRIWAWRDCGSSLWAPAAEQETLSALDAEYVRADLIDPKVLERVAMALTLVLPFAEAEREPGKWNNERAALIDLRAMIAALKTKA